MSRFNLISITALLALVAVGRVLAQAPAAPPAATSAEPPVVEAPTLEEYARNDRIVAAVLESPRETPPQKLRAVFRLLDLGHPDVAAAVLPEAIKEPLDDPAAAALVREFGTARFMKLIRLDQPAAAGEPPSPFAGAREFAQKCLDAAAAEANDPARLAQIIAQLSAPAEEDRYAAAVDLKATGDPGLVAAFAALAAAPSDEVRQHLLAALADMRPAVDGPAVAALAEGRGPFRRDAATLAGKLRIGAALPYLAALAVSSDDADASAATAALAALGMSPPVRSQAIELIEQRLAQWASRPLAADEETLRDAWWSLDPKSQALAVAAYPPRQLQALQLARLTRALVAAGGAAAPEIRRAAVIAAWEEQAILNRPPSPEAAEWIAEMSPAELTAALAECVATDRFAAAAQAATELGRRGDAAILATSDGRPSPLAAAVNSPDRELRFAALTAIMQLAPQRSFPGASFVPTALWHFAAGAGEPLAIVAAPGKTRASSWAGELRAAGFQALPAATGRGLLLAAIDPATAARLSLVVIDSDVGQPLLGETLYQLRANGPTARTPVLIASSTGRWAEAQRQASADPLVLAAPRPDGQGALAALAAKAVALNPQPPATAERRREQAAQALDWIAQLLAAGGPYDELLRDSLLVNQTLFAGDLAEPSLRVLAAAGTADSQQALLDYASAASVPVAARRQAVAALTANVRDHGVQLASEQILRQYDRYNASETADADTQQILGQILDILEKKSPPAN